MLGSLYGLSLSEWLADERTGIGEMRRITLTDGSHITLDSDSAADIAFDTQQRRIILYGAPAGKVVLDSLLTPRPFIVESRDGIARALGTRYTVDQTDHDSIVTVIEPQVAVTNRDHPQQSVTLQTGQSIRLNSKRIHLPEAASPFAASWIQGRLVYQDAPLDQVIRDLARYREGFLKIDEEAGRLRFTGVLPIDNPAAALSILENALPIRAKQPGKWFVWIDLEDLTGLLNCIICCDPNLPYQNHCLKNNCLSSASHPPHRHLLRWGGFFFSREPFCRNKYFEKIAIRATRFFGSHVMDIRNKFFYPERGIS
ncbi:MAG: FecR domain-containing protein [Nitrosomonas sp.]|nr:FecR domain-containing protein [Nitrosomonas sp.]